MYAAPAPRYTYPALGDDGPWCGSSNDAAIWMPILAAGAAIAVGVTVFSMLGGPVGFVVGAGTGLAGMALLVGVSCGPWGDARPGYCPVFWCAPPPPCQPGFDRNNYYGVCQRPGEGQPLSPLECPPGQYAETIVYGPDGPEYAICKPMIY